MDWVSWVLAGAFAAVFVLGGVAGFVLAVLFGLDAECAECGESLL